MKYIEIIVPCYNESECIHLLVKRVEEIAKQITDYSLSILFVNDGSKDSTIQEIKIAAESQNAIKIRYISFSRNFGKESAIYAGLQHSTGDFVVLMDADLQHPPELILDMIKKIEEGNDCCGARRVSRKGEPWLRSVFSKFFYRTMNRLTGMEMVQGGSDYRMMTRQMVETICLLPERGRFTKGIFSWVGFDTYWLEYENVKRVAGVTKWSFWGLMRYAINGFFAFATTPLRAAVYLGFLIDIFAFLYTIYFIQSVLRFGGERTGYATIIILIMFFSGTIILILGIIGEYIARIYTEIKQRPIYIIKESKLDHEVK